MKYSTTRMRLLGFVALMTMPGIGELFAQSNRGATSVRPVATSKVSSTQPATTKVLPKGVLLPGTGTHLAEIGDDFEDPSWGYEANLPKVFNAGEHSQAKNFPLGVAANKRWFEGQKRGQPEVVRRIATPAGGLAGSEGALELRSRMTGGAYPSHRQQQDDFIADVAGRVGVLPVSRNPSVITRVWLPPIDEWENRTGCHFAYRIGLETNPNARLRGGIATPDFDGTYWPGMFLQMDSKEGKGATGRQFDSAYFWIKATDDGRKMRGPPITVTGWWTLGMSVTSDGRVHYFAKPGVEDLTAEDYIGSSFPFGYRAERLRSFFFNVCSGDDGQTWSTQFVIDDAKAFVTQ